MKRFFTIPAAALLASASAVAMAQDMSDPTQYMRARDLVDNPIYTTYSADMANRTVDTGVASDTIGEKTEELVDGAADTMRSAANDAGWPAGGAVEDIDSRYSEIGDVEDILIGENGEIVGIVAEVGGFLDMGDKHVMLRMDELRIVRSGDESYFVTNMSEEQLEEREGLDEGWWS